MNESIRGERTASEPQDRVTELIGQQTAISEVLRAIASSPHDMQPIFDAILDSATRLCRADIGSLRLSEEGGHRLVAVRGDPLLVSQVPSGHRKADTTPPGELGCIRFIASLTISIASAPPAP